MPQNIREVDIKYEMNETRDLAQFIRSMRYHDIPSDVVEACRVFLLDNLASALVGAQTPWAKMVHSLAEQNGSQGNCSIIGTRTLVSMPYAALANGIAIAAFETDQAYYPGSCHPGAVVLPALLAVAQSQTIGGKQFLEAFALAYEAVCRIGRAAGRSVEDKAGFHGPGTNGPFGSAMAVGKALELRAEELVNALGIAGSHGAGLMEFAREGAMTKRLHLGRGAQTGLESALLAQQGFTGPTTVLEGDRGFLNVYSPSPTPSLLTQNLGSDWVLFGVSCKAYACHLSFHPVIDRAVEFRERSGVDEQDIETVRVITNPVVIRKHGQKLPTTILGAQYSLPFSLAIALLRDISDPAIFNESIVGDEEVKALAERVELEAGELGEDPMALITIRTSHREFRLEATDWKGAPTNPCSFEEISEKFRTYASNVIGAKAIEEVITRVLGLESEKDTGILARLLSP